MFRVLIIHVKHIKQTRLGYLMFLLAKKMMDVNDEKGGENDSECI